MDVPLDSYISSGELLRLRLLLPRLRLLLLKTWRGSTSWVEHLRLERPRWAVALSFSPALRRGCKDGSARIMTAIVSQLSREYAT